MTRALVIVDLQNDFVPGGALAVPQGDTVISVINDLMPRFRHIVATKDWHPADHGSFASQHPGHEVGETIKLNGLDQYLWPDHCIQDTPGAAFVEGLDVKQIEQVVTKGEDPGIDSYSGFFDNGHQSKTGLDAWLKARSVTDIYLVGLAQDVCVKATGIDGARLGYNTHVIKEATRPVDVQPGDGERALEEMRNAGVRVVHADEIEGVG
jgi:nicotinamidase/pyrazinamidase